MASNAASITEIAQQLGVSHTTVSRVINGRPGVSADLAHEIRLQLKKMGYRPRAIRPGPRLRNDTGTLTRHGTLAFLYLAQNEQYAPDGIGNTVTAISHSAARAGYDLVFAHILRYEDLPPCILDGRCAGVMLSGRTRDERLLNLLSGFPAVWLASKPQLQGMGDRVIAGNHAAGRMAADYLLERGHRHLAFLSPLAGWNVFEVRGDAFEVAAYRRAASVARLAVPSEPDVSIFEFTQEQIEQRMLQVADDLMKLSPRPTGLFITDSPAALAFYRAATMRGLRIGRDVDPITFGTRDAFYALHPRIAAISFNYELRGLRAINQLIWRIEHPEETGDMEVAIEPCLIPGEIDWPPPEEFSPEGFSAEGFPPEGFLPEDSVPKGSLPEGSVDRAGR